MQAQIEELLSADAPTLARMEDTLTEGYAKALALEAERWRLERRIGEVAREGRTDIGEELRSHESSAWLPRAASGLRYRP
jgi:hypothetical protein